MQDRRPAPKFEIPAALGTVEEIYHPQSEKEPLIIHIQTVHGHYETALQVKEIIRYLKKHYGTKLLFAEGASGILHPEFLSFLQDPEQNLKVVDALAQKGELTGVDLALLDPSIKALGIEDPDLYRKAFQSFKQVIGHLNQSEAWLEKDRFEIDKQASKVFSNQLRDLVSEWLKFNSGQRDFTATTQFLRKAAKESLNLDFEKPLSQFDWPQMTRLVLLQELEKRVEEKALKEESGRLLAWLKDNKISAEFIEPLNRHPEAGLNKEKGSPRQAAEKFLAQALPKGFQFRDYPQVTYSCAQKILSSELDAKPLFAEFDRLFDKLLEDGQPAGGSVPSESADSVRRLIRQYKQHILLQKLMHLELASGEWNEVRAGSLESGADRTKENVPHYETALQFYELMAQREDGFLKKIEKSLSAKRDPQSAILITGGFHTEGMKRLLREKGLGYAVISPHISGEFDSKLYHNVMMRSANLEKIDALLPASAGLQMAGDMGYTRSELGSFEITFKAVTRGALLPDSAWFRNRRSFLLTRSEGGQAEGRPDAALAAARVQNSRSEMRQGAEADDESLEPRANERFSWAQSDAKNYGDLTWVRRQIDGFRRRLLHATSIEAGKLRIEVTDFLDGFYVLGHPRADILDALSELVVKTTQSEKPGTKSPAEWSRQVIALGERYAVGSESGPNKAQVTEKFSDEVLPLLEGLIETYGFGWVTLNALAAMELVWIKQEWSRDLGDVDVYYLMALRNKEKQMGERIRVSETLRRKIVGRFIQKAGDYKEMLGGLQAAEKIAGLKSFREELDLEFDRLLSYIPETSQRIQVLEEINSVWTRKKWDQLFGGVLEHFIHHFKAFIPAREYKKTQTMTFELVEGVSDKNAKLWAWWLYLISSVYHLRFFGTHAEKVPGEGPTLLDNDILAEVTRDRFIPAFLSWRKNSQKDRKANPRVWQVQNEALLWALGLALDLRIYDSESLIYDYRMDTHLIDPVLAMPAGRVASITHYLTAILEPHWPETKILLHELADLYDQDSQRESPLYEWQGAMARLKFAFPTLLADSERGFREMHRFSQKRINRFSSEAAGQHRNMLFGIDQFQVNPYVALRTALDQADEGGGLEAFVGYLAQQTSDEKRTRLDTVLERIDQLQAELVIGENVFPEGLRSRRRRSSRLLKGGNAGDTKTLLSWQLAFLAKVHELYRPPFQLDLQPVQTLEQLSKGAVIQIDYREDDGSQKNTVGVVLGRFESEKPSVVVHLANNTEFVFEVDRFEHLKSRFRLIGVSTRSEVRGLTELLAQAQVTRLGRELWNFFVVGHESVWILAAAIGGIFLFSKLRELFGQSKIEGEKKTRPVDEMRDDAADIFVTSAGDSWKKPLQTMGAYERRRGKILTISDSELERVFGLLDQEFKKSPFSLYKAEAKRNAYVAGRFLKFFDAYTQDTENPVYQSFQTMDQQDAAIFLWNALRLFFESIPAQVFQNPANDAVNIVSTLDYRLCYLETNEDFRHWLMKAAQNRDTVKTPQRLKKLIEEWLGVSLLAAAKRDLAAEHRALRQHEYPPKPTFDDITPPQYYLQDFFPDLWKRGVRKVRWWIKDSDRGEVMKFYSADNKVLYEVAAREGLIYGRPETRSGKIPYQIQITSHERSTTRLVSEILRFVKQQRNEAKDVGLPDSLLSDTYKNLLLRYDKLTGKFILGPGGDADLKRSEVRTTEAAEFLGPDPQAWLNAIREGRARVLISEIAASAADLGQPLFYNTNPAVAVQLEFAGDGGDGKNGLSLPLQEIGAGGSARVFGLPGYRGSVKVLDNPGSGAARAIQREVLVIRAIWEKAKTSETVTVLKMPEVVDDHAPEDLAADSEDFPYAVLDTLAGAMDLTRWSLNDALFKQFSLPQRLRILRDLGGSLAATHQLGYVHADVKPENVLLDAVGQAQWIDFRLSHPVTQSTLKNDTMAFQTKIIGEFFTEQENLEFRLTRILSQSTLGDFLEHLSRLIEAEASDQRVQRSEMRAVPPDFKLNDSEKLRLKTLGARIYFEIREALTTDQGVLEPTEAELLAGFGEVAFNFRAGVVHSLNHAAGDFIRAPKKETLYQFVKGMEHDFKMTIGVLERLLDQAPNEYHLRPFTENLAYVSGRISAAAMSSSEKRQFLETHLGKDPEKGILNILILVKLFEQDLSDIVAAVESRAAVATAEGEAQDRGRRHDRRSEMRQEPTGYQAFLKVYDPKEWDFLFLANERPSGLYHLNHHRRETTWRSDDHKIDYAIGAPEQQGLPPIDEPWSWFESQISSDYTNADIYSYHNLYHNDWFVAFDGKTGRLLRNRKEAVADRTYSMFVVWKDGEVTSEDLVFRFRHPRLSRALLAFLRAAENVFRFLAQRLTARVFGRPAEWFGLQYDRVMRTLASGTAVYRAADTELRFDLSGQIQSAIFGQRLIHGGDVSPLAEMASQFADVNQLFTFPQSVELHRDEEGLVQSYKYFTALGREEFTSWQTAKDERFKRAVETGLMVFSLEPYLRDSEKFGFEQGNLEDLKAKTLTQRGYQEKNTASEAELNPGDYFIRDNYLHIRLKGQAYPHTLIGITRKGKVLKVVIPGDKFAGVGATVQELPERIRQLYFDNYGAGDPIQELVLLVNSRDANVRELRDGQGVFTVKSERAYETVTAVLAMGSPKLKVPGTDVKGRHKEDKRSEVRVFQPSKKHLRGLVDFEQKKNSKLADLVSDDKTTVENALHWLVRTRVYEAAPIIIGMLEKTDEPWRLDRGIQAIGILGQPAPSSAIPVLMQKGLSHKQKNIRARTIAALGKLEAVSAIPQIQKAALNDPLKAVRDQAERTLIKLGEIRQAQTLLEPSSEPIPVDKRKDMTAKTDFMDQFDPARDADIDRLQQTISNLAPSFLGNYAKDFLASPLLALIRAATGERPELFAMTAIQALQNASELSPEDLGVFFETTPPLYHRSEVRADTRVSALASNPRTGRSEVRQARGYPSRGTPFLRHQVLGFLLNQTEETKAFLASGQLTDREAKVLTLRLGLAGEMPKTMEQVKTILGISYSSAGKIYRSAENKAVLFHAKFISENGAQTAESGGGVRSEVRMTIPEGLIEAMAVPEYLNIQYTQQQEAKLLAIKGGREKLSGKAQKMWDHPENAVWGKTLTPAILAEINRYARNTLAVVKWGWVKKWPVVGKDVVHMEQHVLRNLLAWAAWQKTGLEDSEILWDFSWIANLRPFSLGERPAPYREESLEDFKENPEALAQYLAFMKALAQIRKEDFKERYMTPFAGDEQEYDLLGGGEFADYHGETLIEAGVLTAYQLEPIRYDHNLSWFYKVADELSPYALMRDWQSGKLKQDNVREYAAKYAAGVRHLDRDFPANADQISILREYLSAAKAQGNELADDLWQALREEMLKGVYLGSAPDAWLRAISEGEAHIRILEIPASISELESQPFHSPDAPMVIHLEFVKGGGDAEKKEVSIPLQKIGEGGSAWIFGLPGYRGSVKVAKRSHEISKNRIEMEALRIPDIQDKARQLGVFEDLRMPSVVFYDAAEKMTGTSKDFSYVVLDTLADARSLDQWIETGDFLRRFPTLQQRLKIVRDLGSSLIAIHKTSSTHRDVKNENVLLDDSGETQWIDFGSLFREPDLRRFQHWIITDVLTPREIEQIPFDFTQDFTPTSFVVFLKHLSEMIEESRAETRVRTRKSEVRQAAMDTYAAWYDAPEGTAGGEAYRALVQLLEGEGWFKVYRDNRRAEIFVLGKGLEIIPLEDELASSLMLSLSPEVLTAAQAMDHRYRRNPYRGAFLNLLMLQSVLIGAHAVALGFLQNIPKPLLHAQLMLAAGFGMVGIASLSQWLMKKFMVFDTPKRSVKDIALTKLSNAIDSVRRSEVRSGRERALEQVNRVIERLQDTESWQGIRDVVIQSTLSEFMFVRSMLQHPPMLGRQFVAQREALQNAYETLKLIRLFNNISKNEFPQLAELSQPIEDLVELLEALLKPKVWAGAVDPFDFSRIPRPLPLPTESITTVVSRHKEEKRSEVRADTDVSKHAGDPRAGRSEVRVASMQELSKQLSRDILKQQFVLAQGDSDEGSQHLLINHAFDSLFSYYDILSSAGLKIPWHFVEDYIADYHTDWLPKALVLTAIARRQAIESGDETQYAFVETKLQELSMKAEMNYRVEALDAWAGIEIARMRKLKQNASSSFLSTMRSAMEWYLIFDSFRGSRYSFMEKTESDILALTKIAVSIDRVAGDENLQPPFREFLQARLKDEDSKVRLAAAEAVAQSAGGYLVLKQFWLRDKKSTVAYQALATMAGMEESDSDEELQTFLTDELESKHYEFQIEVIKAAAQVEAGRIRKNPQAALVFLPKLESLLSRAELSVKRNFQPDNLDNRFSYLMRAVMKINQALAQSGQRAVSLEVLENKFYELFPRIHHLEQSLLRSFGELDAALVQQAQNTTTIIDRVLQYSKDSPLMYWAAVNAAAERDKKLIEAGFQPRAVPFFEKNWEDITSGETSGGEPPLNVTVVINAMGTIDAAIARKRLPLLFRDKLAGYLATGMEKTPVSREPDFATINALGKIDLALVTPQPVPDESGAFYPPEEPQSLSLLIEALEKSRDSIDVPDVIVSIFEQFLREGIFPRAWPTARNLKAKISASFFKALVELPEFQTVYATQQRNFELWIKEGLPLTDHPIVDAFLESEEPENFIKGLKAESEQLIQEGFDYDNDDQLFKVYLGLKWHQIDISMKEFLERVSYLKRFDRAHPEEGYFKRLFEKSKDLPTLQVSSKTSRKLDFTGVDWAVLDRHIHEMEASKQRINDFTWIEDGFAQKKAFSLNSLYYQIKRREAMAAGSLPEGRFHVDFPDDTEKKRVILKNKKILFDIAANQLVNSEWGDEILIFMRDLIIADVLEDQTLSRLLLTAAPETRINLIKMVYQDYVNHLPVSAEHPMATVKSGDNRLLNIMETFAAEVLGEVKKVSVMETQNTEVYTLVPVGFLGVFRGRAGIHDCSFDTDEGAGVDFTQTMHEDTGYYFVYKGKELKGYVGLTWGHNKKIGNVLSVDVIQSPSLDGKELLQNLFRELHDVAMDKRAAGLALPESMQVAFNFDNRETIALMQAYVEGEPLSLEPIHKESWKRFQAMFGKDPYGGNTIEVGDFVRLRLEASQNPEEWSYERGRTAALKWVGGLTDVSESDVREIIERLNGDDAFWWKFKEWGVDEKLVLDEDQLKPGLSGFIKNFHELGMNGKYSMMNHASNQEGRGDFFYYFSGLFGRHPVTQAFIRHLESLHGKTSPDASLRKRLRRDLEMIGFAAGALDAFTEIAQGRSEVRTQSPGRVRFPEIMEQIVRHAMDQIQNEKQRHKESVTAKFQPLVDVVISSAMVAALKDLGNAVEHFEAAIQLISEALEETSVDDERVYLEKIKTYLELKRLELMGTPSKTDLPGLIVEPFKLEFADRGIDRPAFRFEDRKRSEVRNSEDELVTRLMLDGTATFEASDGKVVGYKDVKLASNGKKAIGDFGFYPNAGLSGTERFRDAEGVPGIAVDGFYRKKYRGIGSSLLGVSLRIAKQQGAIVYETDSISPAARAFFEKVSPRGIDYYLDYSSEEGVVRVDWTRWDLQRDELPSVGVTLRSEMRIDTDVPKHASDLRAGRSEVRIDTDVSKHAGDLRAGGSEVRAQTLLMTNTDPFYGWSDRLSRELEQKGTDGDYLSLGALMEEDLKRRGFGRLRDNLRDLNTRYRRSERQLEGFFPQGIAVKKTSFSAETLLRYLELYIIAWSHDKMLTEMTGHEAGQFKIERRAMVDRLAEVIRDYNQWMKPVYRLNRPALSYLSTTPRFSTPSFFVQASRHMPYLLDDEELSEFETYLWQTKGFHLDTLSEDSLDDIEVVEYYFEQAMERLTTQQFETREAERRYKLSMLRFLSFWLPFMRRDYHEPSLSGIHMPQGIGLTQRMAAPIYEHIQDIEQWLNDFYPPDDQALDEGLPEEVWTSLHPLNRSLSRAEITDSTQSVEEQIQFLIQRDPALLGMGWYLYDYAEEALFREAGESKQTLGDLLGSERGEDHFLVTRLRHFLELKYSGKSDLFKDEFSIPPFDYDRFKAIRRLRDFREAIAALKAMPKPPRSYSLRSEMRNSVFRDQERMDPLLRRSNGEFGNLVADMRELVQLYPGSPAIGKLEGAIRQYEKMAQASWEEQAMAEHLGIVNAAAAKDALREFYGQTLLTEMQIAPEIKVHQRSFSPLAKSQIYVDAQWDERTVLQKYDYHLSSTLYRVSVNGEEYQIGAGFYLEFVYPDGKTDFLYDYHNSLYAFSVLNAAKIEQRTYVNYDDHADSGPEEPTSYSGADPYQIAQLYHINNFHQGLLKDAFPKDQGWQWSWISHRWGAPEEDERALYDNIFDWNDDFPVVTGGVASVDLDIVSRGGGHLLTYADTMVLYREDRARLLRDLSGFEMRAFFISDEYYLKPAAGFTIFADLYPEIVRARLRQPGQTGVKERRSEVRTTSDEKPADPKPILLLSSVQARELLDQAPVLTAKEQGLYIKNRARRDATYRGVRGEEVIDDIVNEQASVPKRMKKLHWGNMRLAFHHAFGDGGHYWNGVSVVLEYVVKSEHGYRLEISDPSGLAVNATPKSVQTKHITRAWLTSMVPGGYKIVEVSFPGMASAEDDVTRSEVRATPFPQKQEPVETQDLLDRWDTLKALWEEIKPLEGHILEPGLRARIPTLIPSLVQLLDAAVERAADVFAKENADEAFQARSNLKKILAGASHLTLELMYRGNRLHYFDGETRAIMVPQTKDLVAAIEKMITALRDQRFQNSVAELFSDEVEDAWEERWDLAAEGLMSSFFELESAVTPAESWLLLQAQAEMGAGLMKMMRVRGILYIQSQLDRYSREHSDPAVKEQALRLAIRFETSAHQVRTDLFKMSLWMIAEELSKGELAAQTLQEALSLIRTGQAEPISTNAVLVELKQRLIGIANPSDYNLTRILETAIYLKKQSRSEVRGKPTNNLDELEERINTAADANELIAGFRDSLASEALKNKRRLGDEIMDLRSMSILTIIKGGEQLFIPEFMIQALDVPAQHLYILNTEGEFRDFGRIIETHPNRLATGSLDNLDSLFPDGFERIYLWSDLTEERVDMDGFAATFRKKLQEDGKLLMRVSADNIRQAFHRGFGEPVWQEAVSMTAKASGEFSVFLKSRRSEIRRDHPSPTTGTHDLTVEPLSIFQAGLLKSDGEPVAFRTAVEAALGMADLSWDAAVMNDYRFALRRMMEQYSRELGFERQSPRIRQKIELLQNNKQILAPFVHIRDSILNNPEALKQIFESAQSLIELNAARAHYVVLIADSDEETQVLHEKLMEFLRLKYPNNSPLRDQLYARIPVFTVSNKLISHFIPKDAMSAWIDWPDEIASSNNGIPEAAQNKQIQANRLLSGERLKETTAHFYGTAITQAVVMLLEGAEASGLAWTGTNRYVQQSPEIFADFQAIAAQARLVSSSA